MLEYYSSIWSPTSSWDQSLIESVQWSFTNDIFRKLHLPRLSYENHLTYMNLQKLSLHRSITGIVELFKICKDFSISNIFSKRLVKKKYRRGHIFKLSVLHLYSKPWRLLIFNRTVNVWNTLSGQFLNFNIIFVFRIHISWFSIFNYEL